MIEDGVNGLLVEHDNKVEIFNAIKRLLENAEFKEKIASGGKVKALHFGSSNMIEDTIKVLNEL